MTPSKTLSVRNLSIEFGGVHAVEDVSFDVEPGEVFAIIGPNGAGKSTIFNLISRLYEPTAGSIHYGDQDLLDLKAHEVVHTGITRTFQNIELFEQSTVLQNLLVGRHSRMHTNPFASFVFTPGVKRAELEHRRKVEDIIDLLEIAQYRDERIADLSYGARKNVELALMASALVSFMKFSTRTLQARGWVAMRRATGRLQTQANEKRREGVGPPAFRAT